MSLQSLCQQFGFDYDKIKCTLDQVAEVGILQYGRFTALFPIRSGEAGLKDALNRINWYMYTYKLL